MKKEPTMNKWDLCLPEKDLKGHLVIMVQSSIVAIGNFTDYFGKPQSIHINEYCLHPTESGYEILYDGDIIRIGSKRLHVRIPWSSKPDPDIGVALGRHYKREGIFRNVFKKKTGQLMDIMEASCVLHCQERSSLQDEISELRKEKKILQVQMENMCTQFVHDKEDYRQSMFKEVEEEKRWLQKEKQLLEAEKKNLKRKYGSVDEFELYQFI